MENLIVDERGGSVPAVDGTLVGQREAIPVASRLVWASMSTRYHPSHPPDESCLFGMDFSFVLPDCVVITSAALVVFTNTFEPALAPEWVVGPVQIEGSVVFARLAGGTEGSDYQLRWTVQDSDGNIWPRTALVLCSLAS